MSRETGAPQVCATIQEADTERVLARMQAVAPECGWLELRLDAAPPGGLDLERIVAARPRPLVVTCRPPREGGASPLSDAERLDSLAHAARLGAEAVDVEWDALDSLPDLPAATEVIVSRHAFGPTPPERYPALLESVRRERATILKLAVAVAGAEDALALLTLAAAESKPTLAIAMGFPGVISRLAPRGGPFTYASADPDRPAAPGQLSAAALGTLLRGRTVSPSTALYGVLGTPVSHSRSPELLNGAFATLGVDAVYGWLETEAPEALLARAEADPGWRGFSVTLPHKRRCALAPRVTPSPAVQAIGALNTLVRRGDGWAGFNTDARAAKALLAAAVEPGASVALLGNGGAARAVAWAARELGLEVSVFARDPGRGQALTAELGLSWGGSLDEFAGGFEVVVNATSVGMSPAPDETPVGAGVLGARAVAYDLVYTPEETRFLREARAGGARVISGLEHFARQAQAQLELWLGEAAHPLGVAWLLDRLRSR